MGLNGISRISGAGIMFKYKEEAAEAFVNAWLLRRKPGWAWRFGPAPQVAHQVVPWSTGDISLSLPMASPGALQPVFEVRPGCFESESRWGRCCDRQVGPSGDGMCW